MKFFKASNQNSPTPIQLLDKDSNVLTDLNIYKVSKFYLPSQLFETDKIKRSIQ